MSSKMSGTSQPRIPTSEGLRSEVLDRILNGY
jgi:hypothetical protein